jgi:hypothetical protein
MLTLRSLNAIGWRERQDVLRFEGVMSPFGLRKAMLQRPKAFLLHGFLGVGKKTFAKHPKQDQQAFRFSHDEWVSRLCSEDPPAACFQDYPAGARSA